jgi:hypothetical protein
MNLKPVVASLFALGLGLSTPILAADEAKEQVKQTAQHKHHAHHQGHRGQGGHRHSHHSHHGHDHGVGAEHGYGGAYAANDRFIDVNSARSPVSAFDWVNRFHFGGMINVDGKYSDRSPLGTSPGFRHHEDASDINVNNANLFVDVDVNCMVTGHIGIAYVADSVNLLDWDVNTNFAGTSFSDSVRGNKGAVWANGRLSVDEAYITVRDFSQSPFFFRGGKMYVPFGDITDIYPITYSFTQLLSQTRGTAAQVGWVGNRGMYGSIYLLAGAESSFRLSHHHTAIVFDGLGSPEDFDEPYTKLDNWGANLGYCGGYDNVRYQLSASYIKDIRDSEYLSSVQDLVRYSFVRNDGRGGMGFRFHQVDGLALHGDATYGPVNLTVNYVAALGDLLSQRDGRRREEGHRHRCHDNDNTGIAAGDITGTYTACLGGYNTGFSLGYQRSWEANPLLPEWRLQGDVGVCILPHTTLTLEYHYDSDYTRVKGLDRFVNENDHGRNDGGNDDNHKKCHHEGDRFSNTAALRLGVVF